MLNKVFTIIQVSDAKNRYPFNDLPWFVIFITGALKTVP